MLTDSQQRLTVGQCATLACLLECEAEKPGNVSPVAAFDDMSHADLTASAVAIAPAMDSAVARRVGRTVWDAVQATRRIVGKNTNLGVVLLQAPLAAVPRATPLQSGIGRILDGLDMSDARAVYAAIRLANPGGLGERREADVHQPARLPLADAMALAAEEDLVARQYTNGFADVLDIAVPVVLQFASRLGSWRDTIVHTQLTLLAKYPDSLIGRKCGGAVAVEASRRASDVLRAGSPGSPPYRLKLAALDGWLRADGHRRNPGTTADVIAAALFAVLRDDRVGLPLRL